MIHDLKFQVKTKIVHTNWTNRFFLWFTTWWIYEKNSQFLIIFGTASKSLQPRFLEIFNIMLLPMVKKSQEIWTTMQHNIQRSLVNQTVGSEFDIHPLFAIMIEELDGCWKEPPLYRHLVGQFHLLRG